MFYCVLNLDVYKTSLFLLRQLNKQSRAAATSENHKDEALLKNGTTTLSQKYDETFSLTEMETEAY